jgi:hypothetical protein
MTADLLNGYSRGFEALEFVHHLSVIVLFLFFSFLVPSDL